MKRMLGLAVLAGAAALTVLAVTALGGTAHRAQPTGVTITPLAHATIATRCPTHPAAGSRSRRTARRTCS